MQHSNNESQTPFPFQTNGILIKTEPTVKTNFVLLFEPELFCSAYIRKSCLNVTVHIPLASSKILKGFRSIA